MFFVAGSALIFGPTSADPDFVADLVSTVASAPGLPVLRALRQGHDRGGTTIVGPLRHHDGDVGHSGHDLVRLRRSARASTRWSRSADWLYLLGILPAAVGDGHLPGRHLGARSALAAVLDVLVLGSALLTSSQLLVLDEVSALNPSTWDTVVYEIYPVTDVLLAALAVLLLIRTAGRPRLDLTLVALGFATWTATDNGYALLLLPRRGLQRVAGGHRLRGRAAA